MISKDAKPRIAAGIVLFRRVSGEPRFLILRAFRYWDFPKGELADGEDPRKGAIRELAEETGLGVPDFPFGEVYAETEPYAGGKIARYYIGEANAGEVFLPVNPELGRPEHHEFRWATFAEAAALLGPRVRKILAWAMKNIERGSGGRAP